MFSVLLFASCQDDLQTSVHTGPGIRFSVSDGADWRATRAEDSSTEETAPRDSLLGVLPLKAADGGEGLYLHASVSDRIGTTAPKERSDSLQTRGLLVGSDNFHDSFGVMASVYTGSWNEDSCLPDYMYNVKVTQASQWTTSYYWPDPVRTSVSLRTLPTIRISALTSRYYGFQTRQYPVPRRLNIRLVIRPCSTMTCWLPPAVRCPATALRRYR